MKKTLAAAALCAAMLLGASAMAETTPLTLAEQDVNRQESVKLACLHRQEYGGVTVGDQWMRQARVNSTGLAMHLFRPDGEQVIFRQSVRPDTSGAHVCLTMYVNAEGGGQLLQMEKSALDTLLRCGVTEIAVADRAGYQQARYQVKELSDMCAALDVGEHEQLCIGALDEPVTIVGVDGVRRNISI